MKTIKLMADYQCFPLWEASPGKFGNIDPNSLPISESLRDQLIGWADAYDRTLNIENPIASGFANVDAIENFNTQGIELASSLQKELGSEFLVIIKINALLKINENQ